MTIAFPGVICFKRNKKHRHLPYVIMTCNKSFPFVILVDIRQVVRTVPEAVRDEVRNNKVRAINFQQTSSCKTKTTLIITSE